MLYNMKEQTLGVCRWRGSWIFNARGPYYTETSLFICRTNQWTGFYTTRASVMKELMLCYLHVFIETYFLVMEKWLTPVHPNMKGRCF